MQAQEGAAPILEAVAATEPVENPITFFAPTNEAFQAISDVVGGLSPEEVVAVRIPLLLHRSLLHQYSLW